MKANISYVESYDDDKTIQLLVYSDSKKAIYQVIDALSNVVTLSNIFISDKSKE